MGKNRLLRFISGVSNLVAIGLCIALFFSFDKLFTPPMVSEHWEYLVTVPAGVLCIGLNLLAGSGMVLSCFFGKDEGAKKAVAYLCLITSIGSVSFYTVTLLWTYWHEIAY